MKPHARRTLTPQKPRDMQASPLECSCLPDSTPRTGHERTTRDKQAFSARTPRDRADQGLQGVLRFFATDRTLRAHHGVALAHATEEDGRMSEQIPHPGDDVMRHLAALLAHRSPEHEETT